MYVILVRAPTVRWLYDVWKTKKEGVPTDVLLVGWDAYGLFAEGATFTFFGDLCEEVVAFVVDEDECGEIGRAHV